MRHVDERDPELLLDRLQLDLECLAQLCIERAEWFVEQQDRRVEDERPRKRNALLLPAGELRRTPLSEPSEPDRFEHRLYALARLLPLHMPPAQPEGDIVEDVEVWEERIALEDGVDLPLVRRRRRHVDPVEQDPAAVGPFEPGDQA